MCECQNCGNCENGQKKVVSRRKFMAWSVGAINLAVFGAVFGPVLGFLGSPLRHRQMKQWVPVLDEGALGEGETKEVPFTVRVKDGYEMVDRTYVVYLVRSEEGIVALDPSCTHLGCRIKFQADKNRYFCPCHGGVFDNRGTVVSGPPPKPLVRHAVEVREGKIWVQRSV
ncbi:MAG: ubiquinol-cytochrome c reductase iron-sulfur subunit [Fimbriimonadaceae bacterium]|nr:ubiquinol-cytochrome c reductase iron-sulfur subunit [Fimbriimonadaceae bacterium]